MPNYLASLDFLFCIFSCKSLFFPLGEKSSRQKVAQLLLGLIYFATEPSLHILAIRGQAKIFLSSGHLCSHAFPSTGFAEDPSEQTRRAQAATGAGDIRR
jgi:hypothetical protein